MVGESLVLEYIERLNSPDDPRNAADYIFVRPPLGKPSSFTKITAGTAIVGSTILSGGVSLGVGLGGFFRQKYGALTNDTLRLLILEEIHKAFCIHSRRYKKELAELRHNTQLLIAAIAGYIAASFGVATAVIAALVAAILRIVLAMGITVFCRRFQLEILKFKSQSSSLRVVNKAIKKLPHKQKRKKRE